MTIEPLTVAIKVNQPLHDARVEFERAFVVAALRQHAGNISHTAQAIGMERCAFHRKLRQLGIRVTIERVFRVTTSPSPFAAECPLRGDAPAGATGSGTRGAAPAAKTSPTQGSV